ncbi:MAG: alpha/beta fold hydrolase, partial [Planctomycetota bacterium]
MRKLHAVTAALLLLAFATAAVAAPTVGEVESKLRKGKKLTIKVRVTMEAPGEVILSGDVNGVPVSMTKRFRRAKTKRLKFKVNVGKLGFTSRDTALDFDLRVRAVEEGGASDDADADLFAPIPLVFLHGFTGSCEDGQCGVFETALDVAMPGVYCSEGKKANLVLFTYDSTGSSLATLGGDLEGAVKRTMKATGFRKVDLVGHSMGGLVCRSYLARPGAAASVRKCVMLATPNEGTPLAWVASLLAGFVTPDLLPEEFQDIAGDFLDPDFATQLPTFFPDYDWLTADFFVRLALGDLTGPLTDLNAIAPAAGVDFHAFAYSSTGEEVGDVFGLTTGTVERIDLTEVDLTKLLALFAGTAADFTLDDIPLDALILGDGDGLVPLRSALMTDVPAWKAAMTAHDLG